MAGVRVGSPGDGDRVTHQMALLVDDLERHGRATAGDEFQPGIARHVRHGVATGLAGAQVPCPLPYGRLGVMPPRTAGRGSLLPRTHAPAGGMVGCPLLAHGGGAGPSAAPAHDSTTGRHHQGDDHQADDDEQPHVAPGLPRYAKVGRHACMVGQANVLRPYSRAPGRCFGLATGAILRTVPDRADGSRSTCRCKRFGRPSRCGSNDGERDQDLRA